MRTGHPSSPIAYRETIHRSASGESKYIRYYDGRGHFGHVRLELIPHPGELCSVSIDATCPLPEQDCRAARNALLQRFDRGRFGHLPLIGFEVRLTGGSYLPRHSYPEACAIVACMAYDEALLSAGLFVVELYVGVRLLVEPDALKDTIRKLANLLGEVRANHAITNIVQLEVEVPVRLCDAVQEALHLCVLDMFPLARDMQYRPLTASVARPNDPYDDLDEWT